MKDHCTFLKKASYYHFLDWNIDRILFSKELKGNYPMYRLEDIMAPRSERVKNADYDGTEEIVAKIRFSDGKVFFRKEKEPKTDLNVSRKGDLIVSNINFEKGAFAINTWGRILTSTDYTSYRLKETDGIMALPEYLNLALRTELFLNMVGSVKPKGMKTRARYDFIKQFFVPVAPIETQRRLVLEYCQSVRQAEIYEKKSKSLTDSMEEYLFSALEIDASGQQEEGDVGKLVIKKFSKMGKWGVEANLNAVLPQDLFQSRRYETVPITKLCRLNPKTEYPSGSLEISFLPMECISDTYGEILLQKEGTASASSGYTRFQENDILWAKITPCMQNGKCAIAKNLKNGFGYGSTEYFVFRPNETLVLPEYLYLFLRTKRIRKIAQKYFTGSAGQQRVSRDFIEGLTIPLLPVSSTDSAVLTQEKLVERVFSMKQQMKQNDHQAVEIKKQAKTQFENAIFS